MRRRAALGAASALVVAGAAAAATEPIQIRTAATARLLGPSPESRAGSTVASAGDVDGIDDVMVGSDVGGAFVVFGRNARGVVDLRKLVAERKGYAIPSMFPVDVANAGDVNSDGRPDALVLTLDDVYIVFGRKAPGAVDLKRLVRDRAGIVLANFPSRDEMSSTDCCTLAAAGDVNGDRVPDLGIGVSGLSRLRKDAGAVFVVFGAKGAEPLSLSRLPGPRGLRLDGGGRGDRAGRSLARLGSKLPARLLIGAPAAEATGRSPDSGVVYVVPVPRK